MQKNIFMEHFFNSFLHNKLSRAFKQKKLSRAFKQKRFTIFKVELSPSKKMLFYLLH